MMGEKLYVQTLAEDAFILYLSGAAEMKNDREIWTTNQSGERITIEFVNDSSDNIIVRGFYANGSKRWENKLKPSEQVSCGLTGISSGWYSDGTIMDDNIRYINGRKQQ
ncbi:MAG: hypothetical protein WC523_04370 [Patescibacteria group bacterium]